MNQALLGGVTLAPGNVDIFTVAIDVDTINEEIDIHTYSSLKWDREKEEDEIVMNMIRKCLTCQPTTTNAADAISIKRSLMDGTIDQ